MSRSGKFLITEAVVTTVDTSEQTVGFEKVVFPMVLERTVDAEKTELSERRAGRSHQSATILVFIGSQRLQQLAFMSLRDDGERTLSVVDPERDQPETLTFLALRAEVESCYLVSNRVVVDRDLDDFFRY